MRVVVTPFTTRADILARYRDWAGSSPMRGAVTREQSAPRIPRRVADLPAAVGVV